MTKKIILLLLYLFIFINLVIAQFDKPCISNPFAKCNTVLDTLTFQINYIQHLDAPKSDYNVGFGLTEIKSISFINSSGKESWYYFWVNDWMTMAWLKDQVKVGDKVAIIYHDQLFNMLVRNDCLTCSGCGLIKKL